MDVALCVHMSFKINYYVFGFTYIYEAGLIPGQLTGTESSVFTPALTHICVDIK